MTHLLPARFHTPQHTWPVYYRLGVFNILKLSRNAEEEEWHRCAHVFYGPVSHKPSKRTQQLQSKTDFHKRVCCLPTNNNNATRSGHGQRTTWYSFCNIVAPHLLSTLQAAIAWLNHCRSFAYVLVVFYDCKIWHFWCYDIFVFKTVCFGEAKSSVLHNCCHFPFFSIKLSRHTYDCSALAEVSALLCDA